MCLVEAKMKWKWEVVVWRAQDCWIIVRSISVASGRGKASTFYFYKPVFAIGLLVNLFFCLCSETKVQLKLPMVHLKLQVAGKGSTHKP